MSWSHDSLLVRSVGREGVFRGNWTFEREFGWQAEELRSAELVEWIHPYDQERLRAALQDVTEAPGVPCVLRHCTKDGGWRELQFQFRNVDGQVMALATAVRRQQAPQEHASGQHAPEDRPTLGETLDDMARVVEASNPGLRCSILLVDELGERIIGGAGPSLPEEYNKAVEGLRIGPTVGSCGTAAYWNTPVVVEDIGNDPLWADLRGAARLAGVAACWSQPVVAWDGRVLGAMALYDVEPGAPSRHQMGGLAIAARMVGLAIDRHRLEEQVRRAEKMEALGLLAGGIAHDFNNLLAVIIGNTEIALSRSSCPDDLAEILGDVMKAGKGAADLCGQILAFAGRGQASLETVSCNLLLEDLASLLGSIVSKDTEVALDLCKGDGCVVGDVAQLQSLLINLVKNASDAIGREEGLVTISTNVRQCASHDLLGLIAADDFEVGPYVELEVADSGTGIEASKLERIFDPFFSTKDRGRGLGLAMVQGIVHGHGGALRVSSEVGVGSKFSILLPLASSQQAVALEPEMLPEVPEGSCVLVADDEKLVRDMVARTLRDNGLEVVLATDGERALRTFLEHRERIDCVVLDYRMPRLDGGQVLREIRKVDREVPVLMVSGYAERDLLDRYRADGLDAVLHKPTPRRLLLDKVCGALRTLS